MLLGAARRPPTGRRRPGTPGQNGGVNEHDVEQVEIATLTADQRHLLEMYLRGAMIPYELTERTVEVPEDRARDLYAALSIVVRAGGDEAGGRQLSDDAAGVDDPDSATSKPPLVRHQPTIADGRAIASRSRRIIGAVTDWLILDLWALAAHAAGAPNWATFVTLGVYVVMATALCGRTIGKWAVGTVVVSHRDAGSPGWLRSVVRWLAVSWSGVVSLVLPYLPVALELAGLAVLLLTYMPVLWDREGRGWHDRAADTMVVVAKR